MLVWIDLEMTGLDPERHVIVEVATIVTNDDLDIVAEGPDIVVHRTATELAEMDDFVRSMHKKSGLLAKIEASTTSSDEAAAQTLAFINEHVPTPRTVPLAGNSIGTDRRFLARQWPAVEDFLHYRSIDVSTLKELARRWRPDVYAATPKKSTAHRALEDIRESIEEMRFYREHFLQAPRAVESAEPQPSA